MNISFEIPQLHAPSSIALGTFDGLHLGHRQVVAAMLQSAQQQDLQAWVFTFQNHPATVLRPTEVPPALTLWPEKITLLQNSYALDGIVLLAFDLALSEMSPEDFVTQILVQQMQIRHVSVGYNFRFGYQARGDAMLLQRMGQELGFAVTVVPACKSAGDVVSSTRIRALLAQGQLEPALDLLAGQFLMQGEVVRGQGIAAKVLGVPTANLKLEQNQKLLPRKGVYACRVRLAGEAQYRDGVMNLGLRPTFNGQDLSLEVYILDFSGEIYGQTLEVYLQAWLRPEQRFEGPEALKTQIHLDIEQARQRLQSCSM